MLGVFVRPVGLRGEIKLRETGDFWMAALASRRLTLRRASGSEPIEVTSVRPGGAAAHVLRLRGVEDRDAARALVGSELVLGAGPLDVEAPEALRPFQIRGFRVVTLHGEDVGEIVDVEAMPAQDLLVVRGPHGEHRIPLVEAIVQNIDAAAGIVRIDPPAGLLEL